jgi:hypothetical protein
VIFISTTDFAVAIQFLSLKVIRDFWHSVSFIWSSPYEWLNKKPET